MILPDHVALLAGQWESFRGDTAVRDMHPDLITRLELGSHATQAIAFGRRVGPHEASARQVPEQRLAREVPGCEELTIARQRQRDRVTPERGDTRRRRRARRRVGAWARRVVGIECRTNVVSTVAVDLGAIGGRVGARWRTWFLARAAARSERRDDHYEDVSEESKTQSFTPPTASAKHVTTHRWWASVARKMYEDRGSGAPSHRPGQVEPCQSPRLC